MTIPQPSQHRKVVVFEGPAGSGKSYLMKKVSDSLGDQASMGDLPEIDRPRAYLGETGLWHAQLKDYRSSLHMLGADEKIALIDRWVISQQVYDTVRYHRKPTTISDTAPYLSNDALAYAFMMASNGILAAWQEHYARMNLQHPTLTIDMLFIFVVSPSTITDNLRQGPIEGGRVYPYSADEETGLYRQAAFAMQQFSHDPLITPTMRINFEVCRIFGPGLDGRLDTVITAIGEFLKVKP